MSESHLTTETPSRAGHASDNTPDTPDTPNTESRAEFAETPNPRVPPVSLGRALPGNHEPEALQDEGAEHSQDGQRPSFWRRIALGRKGSAQSEMSSEAHTTPTVGNVANGSLYGPESGSLPADALEAAPYAQSAPLTAPPPSSLPSIENRIVEPMLQALVSVEAKVERSHIELVGRSDQVEQRLTQLWDIEEQLGGLSELQESVLRVTEQQRRLESAVASQTKTIRWLIAAVFLSLAGAAFVVAALLR